MILASDDKIKEIRKGKLPDRMMDLAREELLKRGVKPEPLKPIHYYFPVCHEK